jgi:type IV secretory pathway ATPase VirB11/archaellum biosynthesis ATPase
VAESPTVPAPEPPDSPDAWYAPGVRAQYEVAPGVVVTVRERSGDRHGSGVAFSYAVREPSLSGAGEAGLDRLRDYFADAPPDRPLTREGARERVREGFDGKHERVLDRLLDLSADGRRRVEYHALREVRCLGELTPLALDERIEVADTRPAGSDAAGDATWASDDGEEPRTDGRLVVHTADFAPARTGVVDPDAELLSRFASERSTRYTVDFRGFEVPVVRYREHTLGGDPFVSKYAVQEPDLLPGDEALVAACKERVWETGTDVVLGGDGVSVGDGATSTADAPTGAGNRDRAAFVRERAEELLSRRLTARNTRAWLAATRHRLRSTLAEHGLAVPPADERYATDRLDDLVYYVLRDFVGYGPLTVPIRDPHLEDVEANRVGERVKVVPRSDAPGSEAGDADDRRPGPGRDGPERRVPTNLSFADEPTFINVVRKLAAADGVELDASQPSAKVNLDPPGVDETIRCAVALPAITEGGPHVSIRKQAPGALTPVDLVRRDALSVDLVALLWQFYEHHGVVLFSGPTGVGETTLMNAHMPFIDYQDRPVSIDEGSREVRLPHETGVSLSTRDHQDEFKRVTMADLMTEANYLNPDTEVIAEINTPASFETFGESLNTGHGILGTTHAEDVEKLVNRVVEQGLPAYLLREIDLVVFPRHAAGERYVAEAVEFCSETEYAALDTPGERGRDHGVIEKDGTPIYWNRVAERKHDGSFRHAFALDGSGGADREATASDRTRVFDRLGRATDRPVADVEREFRRKRRYVEHLVQEDRDDFADLLGFLADLRANEAATVERVRDRQARATDGGADGSRPARPDEQDR